MLVLHFRRLADANYGPLQRRVCHAKRRKETGLTTIREIAELIGAPVPPAAFEISRVSSIEAATPVALVFATDIATLGAALNSPAGAILTRSALLSPTEAGKSALTLDLADPRLLGVSDPRYSAREIRLRPEEYRRLWEAIRAEMALDSNGRPIRIDHPGYGPSDAFFKARGKASAVATCNTWAAHRLRLAGVKTSLWSPFVEGLVWRYRKVAPLAG